jgi:hypothetical protein
VLERALVAALVKEVAQLGQRTAHGLFTG